MFSNLLIAFSFAFPGTKVASIIYYLAITLVDLLILHVPEPNITILLTTLYASLSMKVREWVVAYLAALILLPSNFSDLDELLTQTAASMKDFEAAWLSLLLTFQGDATIASYADCFRVLAKLAGAPKGSLARLFHSSLPAALQLALVAFITAPLWRKKWRL